jgi:hypothetical protein
MAVASGLQLLSLFHAIPLYPNVFPANFPKISQESSLWHLTRNRGNQEKKPILEHY